MQEHFFEALLPSLPRASPCRIALSSTRQGGKADTGELQRRLQRPLAAVTFLPLATLTLCSHVLGYFHAR